MKEKIIFLCISHLSSVLMKRKKERKKEERKKERKKELEIVFEQHTIGNNNI